jgi:hypothetical protein
LNSRTKRSGRTAFADPGRLDTHTATINWGDGTQTTATVAERSGVGLAGGAHSYQSKGSYAIKITIRDDDGASTQTVLVVSVRA